MRTTARALALGCALLAIFAAGSSARTIQPYGYSTSFNASTSTAGAFSNVDSIAVDSSTNHLYALDRGHGGVLDKFDMAGNPVAFTDPGLAGSSSRLIGVLGDGSGSTGSNGPDLAVDNSGSATQGNIYAIQPSHDEVYSAVLWGFDETGKALPGEWPICGRSCGHTDDWQADLWGVAVTPQGQIWGSSPGGFYASTIPSFLTPFDITGNRDTTIPRIAVSAPEIIQAGNFGYVTEDSTAQAPRRLEIDADGNFYLVAVSVVEQSVNSGNVVMKYDPQGNLLNEAVSVTFPLSATDVAVDRSSGWVYVNFGNKVAVYDAEGKQVDTLGLPAGPYLGLLNSKGVAVDPSTHKVYVGNARGSQTIDVFTPQASASVPNVTTTTPISVTSSSATLRGTLDPDGGGNTTDCHFEWGLTSALGQSAPCAEGNVFASAGGPQQVTANIGSLTKANRYHYRLVVKNANNLSQMGQDRAFRAANAPTLSEIGISSANTDTTQVDFKVDQQGGNTKYTVEVGTTPAYGMTFPGHVAITINQIPNFVKAESLELTGLTPDTLYHYRITAENSSGSVVSGDRTFHTFPFIAVLDDPCPNALTRQQTGSVLLRDCRAYELVSAADQGGYNVESDLAPGQEPFAGYPEATDKVLYAVHDGGIPGTGSPTNRGPDPYVATRSEAGWTTKYVGIPSDGAESAASLPFSSTLGGADEGLGAFAFAGPEICDPCFPDGSTNVPLRLPSGQLVKGMAGSLDPGAAEPAGVVRKYLSADGSHFLFGSTAQFEPAGKSNGEVSLYDRDLETGATQVVSTMPDGLTMSGNGNELAVLDVSADGSRVLVGKLVKTDPAGNDYWHPYMHVGSSPESIDLAPGSTNGVLYAGMDSSGTRVVYSSVDKLDLGDTDGGADLYRVNVGAASIASTEQLSAGSEGTGNTDACDPAPNAGGNNWNAVGGASPNDCGVVAIGGGGGVSPEDGSAYFVSPEKLAGSASGTLNQPNLYVSSPGSPLEYVTTLEPANPAVLHGVAEAETRHSSDFQVARRGSVAAFTMTTPFGSYENNGFVQVIRHDRGSGDLVCASCPLSLTPQSGNAALATNGLSISDDGRVFFNSRDRLVLRDSNKRLDAYQWSPADGSAELISTGTSPQDSSILSVTANGRDAFFFTREKLVSGDLNGPIVKIYDAREEGGFFVIPPQPPCKASDECHGAGTIPAPPAPIRTISGTDGQPKSTPQKCKSGFVRKHGKCTRKPKKHKTKNHRSKR